MLPQLTTLRTITQYGLARLRVLYTTRSLWSPSVRLTGALLKAATSESVLHWSR